MYLEKNPCSEKGGFAGSLENGSFPFDADSRAVFSRSHLWERPSLVSNALCDASHGVFSSYKLWFQKYLKTLRRTWKLSTQAPGEKNKGIDGTRTALKRRPLRMAEVAQAFSRYQGLWRWCDAVLWEQRGGECDEIGETNIRAA